MKTFFTNQFSYNRESKTFSADYSDFSLQQSFAITALMDFGFQIESTKTGVQVEFRFTHRLQDNEDTDGELSGWAFESTTEDFDGCKFKCIFYND